MGQPAEPYSNTRRRLAWKQCMRPTELPTTLGSAWCMGITAHSWEARAMGRGRGSAQFLKSHLAESSGRLPDSAKKARVWARAWRQETAARFTAQLNWARTA